jgi:hypothetical protein
MRDWRILLFLAGVIAAYIFLAQTLVLPNASDWGSMLVDSVSQVVASIYRNIIGN